LQSPKKSAGRRPSANARKERVEVRMNTDELAKLDFCVKAKHSDRSAVIREGIQIICDSLTSNQSVNSFENQSAPSLNSQSAPKDKESSFPQPRD